MPKSAVSRYSEEPLYEIIITGKCNFRCKFCSTRAKGLAKGQMSLPEFKKLISEIKVLSRKEGKPCPVSIGGGEPFLHPQANEMIAFAVKQLGRKNVSVVTNLSTFPTNAKEAKELLIKLGKPELNISLDREHLRFGKQVAEKVNAMYSAAKELHSKISLFAVVQNKYQEMHPWPREIANAIPAGLKRNAHVKREQYSTQDMNWLQAYLRELAGRKKEARPIWAYDIPLPFLSGGGPTRLLFCPQGKVFMGYTPLALHFPQLSVGNWLREPLWSIVKVNVPFKKEQLSPLFGFGGKGAKIESKRLREKQRLFARQALRRLKKHRNQRRAK